MLHITNEDTASALIAQSGLFGTVLPWQDVLHEGPVPAELSLQDLSKLRARYISDCRWADYADTLRNFQTRDETLLNLQDYEEVLLWFEANLYDQLQLIQLLDWFSKQEYGNIKLSLICIGEFPGIERFIGFGQLDSKKMMSLFSDRITVSKDSLTLAQKEWKAFRASTPRDIEVLREEDVSDWPQEQALLRQSA